jgi:MFS family permease
MTFVQPYLLHEVLHIAEERQGSLIGLLQSLNELIVVLLASFIGGTSDKLGRRIVYVVGACIFTLGFIIYPLAETEKQLLVARMIYAAGFAGASVMMHVCLAEYSQETSRGRWLGTIGIFNGLGVVLMATVLSRMPQWYIGLGFDAVQAVRFSYWTFAVYLLLLIVVLRLGLAPGETHVNRRESSLKVAMRGFAAARENPRIMLAFAMAFASRGDLAILTTFFSLWFLQRGNELGLKSAESMVKAGMLFGLSQAVGLLWSFPIGWIMDRLHRMTAMCLAFGLATAGYLALGIITDPFVGNAIVIACVLAGMGESSAMTAGGVLIGQEAPITSRGAVLGTYSLMGALGIMVLTFTGGFLFDHMGRTAPFIMMGCINLVILVATLSLRRSSMGKVSRANDKK